MSSLNRWTWQTIPPMHARGLLPSGLHSQRNNDTLWSHHILFETFISKRINNLMNDIQYSLTISKVLVSPRQSAIVTITYEAK